MRETISQSKDFCEDDYIQGMNDCDQGVEHKSGMGSSYDHGYAVKYNKEQSLTGGYNG